MLSKGITGLELSKMDSNIPAGFPGGIEYIKYQHPGGDSPEVPSPVKQFVKQDKLPQSKEKIIAREASSKFERDPSNIRRTRSSPSYGRHPRRGPSHRRRQHMVNVVEDAGPFADKAVRRSFLWKLYLMLAFQLGYTVGIICMFIYWKFLKIWVRRRPWFCYSLLPAILLMVIALACCDQARRKFPLNVILLALFTILMGTWLGSLDAFFDADSLMWTVGSTALVTLGLCFFALQKKWQLTITSGILLVLLYTVAIIGTLCIIMPSELTDVFYTGIGTLLFGIYLLVDTQLMLGKRHHYRLTPDEYVFAVLNVYIDILNLFLFILRFVGFMK
ncbi:protein lifeguard 1-like [Thamnophis elegans]|uniref:protein lifeguard 1-like n=1 Tax=Thamnophis elegans TaxID=35005 RepID=UPI001376A180|nr:protein lifeguard 1-like [Thamnophis elegans]